MMLCNLKVNHKEAACLINYCQLQEGCRFQYGTNIMKLLILIFLYEFLSGSFQTWGLTLLKSWSSMLSERSFPEYDSGIVLLIFKWAVEFCSWTIVVEGWNQNLQINQIYNSLLQIVIFCHPSIPVADMAECVTVQCDISDMASYRED